MSSKEPGQNIARLWDDEGWLENETARLWLSPLALSMHPCHPVNDASPPNCFVAFCRTHR